MKPPPHLPSLSKHQPEPGEGRELKDFLKTLDPAALRPSAPPRGEPRHSTDAVSARDPMVREWLDHVLAGRIG